jgi:hypothetical protein
MKNIIIVLLLLAFVTGCGQKKKEPTVQDLMIKIKKDSIRINQLQKNHEEIQKKIDSISNSPALTIDQLQKVFRTKIR